jgi:hypothetical protein
VFSLPSKCGFLSQFSAIFFLNIRPQWSEAEEPAPDEDVSKDSPCFPFFYIPHSSSDFYRYIIPPFLVAKKLFEKVFSFLIENQEYYGSQVSI